MHPNVKRWPLAAALEIARDICNELEPFCVRHLIAGSVRREKATVKDVEIVYIGRTGPVLPHGEMFPVQCNFAERMIDSMLESCFLAKRPNVNGTPSWGPSLKYAVHVPTGLSVDLFAATEANWWNQIVCRTGPKESNTRICSAAIARGWTWHPTKEGFSRDNGETFVVDSEESVFRFVDLPCLPPNLRR